MNGEKEPQDIDNDQICYGIVGNIPSELHSADVRAFFSQFVEEKGFLRFHYRHRPEVQKNDKQGDSTQNTTTTPRTCCCIVKLYKDKMDEFIKAYNGQNWVDKAGKLFSQKAVISKIRLGCSNVDGQSDYQTKQEKLQNTRMREEFAQDDLKKLPELNPPSVMPNGNVGTPLSVFMDLIRKCKFPPHLIKKLGLNFPRSKRRKYGNVPFDYGGTVGDDEQDDDDDDDDDNDDQLSHEISSETSKSTDNENAESCSTSENNRRDWRSSCDNKNSSDSTSNNSTQSLSSNHEGQKSDLLHPVANKTSKCSNTINRKSKRSFNDTSRLDENPREVDSSDGELEEWDRHEALHNDVTSQERTKERLFEDYIELKWEKGGSGLVWYTDAAFWKQQEEADFDEETVDDWDVDMSIYEEEGGGDVDAKALLQLRLEEQWRKGQDIHVDPNRVGSFEKHTRGMAGRVMRKQGWKEGQSLGCSQVGITEPIASDGQKPTSKRGLGYYGEKLIRYPKRARPTREAVISTVYDEKEDKNADIFQSKGPHAIKYRDNIEFVPQKEPATSSS